MSVNKNKQNNSIMLNKKLQLENDFPSPLYSQWKEQVIKDLKGDDFESTLTTKTYEGIDLQPIYTSDDLSGLDFVNEFPGFANYLRGISSAGYLKDGWQIAQTINTDNPQEFNKLLKNSLKNGQNAIILDEEYNRFRNHQQNTIKEYLQDIDLNNFPINIFCKNSTKDFLPEFESFLQRQDFQLKNITGGIYSSPISFLTENGYLPEKPEKIFDELNEAINSINNKNSKLRTILIDGSIYNNAGSNAVQDLAFSLAEGSEYVFQLSKRGNNSNKIASQISFKFGIGSFYFMEIAKLRAARILWSKILEEYGVDTEFCKMHIIAKTTLYNQSIADIHNNILRGTTEAFSAILGGVDMLDVTPFDQSISSANEFSLHLARNIQNILKEETHLDKVIDAAGGSYFVEKLTDELCTKAWALFQKVEGKGGIIEALKSNFIQDEIEKVNKERLSDFAEGKSILVGVNKYVNKGEEPKSKNNFLKRDKDNASINGKQNIFRVKPISKIRAAEQFEK